MFVLHFIWFRAGHQEHLGTALVLITIGRNFARLCKDKYASNVVEKLLETNGDIPITFIQSLLQMNDQSVDYFDI